MTVSVIPDDLRSVKVTFSPPEEPNGNITEYIVNIYDIKDRLDKNISLNVIRSNDSTVDAVIEGLKGGRNYTIQVKDMAP